MARSRSPSLEPLLPATMSSIHKNDYEDEEHRVENTHNTSDDPNEEFGGTEAREQMEKKLLRKLDLRMSILIIIYILNYVRARCLPLLFRVPAHTSVQIDRNNASSAKLVCYAT